MTEPEVEEPEEQSNEIGDLPSGTFGFSEDELSTVTPVPSVYKASFFASAVTRER